MIINETENARAGLPSGITAKVNSLVDPSIIELLYEASNAGVKVNLIVRGICCLRAGVKGYSDNIKVYSIVGQLLEHSRIFRFENGGAPKLYMGSADWMPRNLDRRVELVFPVEEADLKKRGFEILDIMLQDNVNARIQKSDSTYILVDKRGKQRLNSQKYFSKLALMEQRKIKNITVEKTIGTPIVPKHKEEAK